MRTVTHCRIYGDDAASLERERDDIRMALIRRQPRILEHAGRDWRIIGSVGAPYPVPPALSLHDIGIVARWAITVKLEL